MAVAPKESKTNTDTNSLKFGTLKGVFTPSILTILGVIMYLRFGWVVGNGGILGSMAIVLLAHVISVATGMSICSIATSRTVKAGGDYYMISRSLGLPMGGTIGVALFFALALSMSLYLLGFAESVLDAFSIENTLMNRRIAGSIACVALTTLTFFSTSVALKVQYLVLAAIVLSMVSLFLGKGHSGVESGREVGLWFAKDSASFETLFAVFFPAVTGFTAGVAMSGDLKNPRKSIPLGTMGAILFGLAVYLIIPVFLAAKAPADLLQSDKMVWLKVARFPSLVIAGVFAATLSSALGSVLGAPRYIQALANDGVVPKFLGKGYGPLNEPRIGTIATFIIAEAGILIGELDLIARVITMFFLASYGFLCLASGVQAWSGIPSYRPDFRTPVWVSLIGAATCVGVMFKLDTLAMVGAIIGMAGIYAVLKRRQFRAAPQDTWGGFWSAVVQAGVLHLHRRKVDSKNWRPNAIVFGGPPSERQHLILLAKWLFSNRGLSTYYYIVKGAIKDQIKHARSIEPSIRDIVGGIYPQMLTRVSVADDVYTGVRNVSQSYGLSGMTPNTVLMGYAENSEHPADYTKLVSDMLALDYNVLLFRHDAERSFGKKQTIDIWWGGLERNGSMMLLVGYLVTSSETWAGAKVRINVIVDDPAKAAASEANLARVIKKSRISATANVIYNKEGHPVPDLITETSADTDLTVLGLRPPSDENSPQFVERVNQLLEGLGSVLLVRASSHFDGASLLFDDE